MADDLVLDVIGAMRNASLGEVASLVSLLERQKKNRPVVAAPKARSVRPQRASREPQPDNRRDAYEITMPNELLDSVVRTPPAREEEPPASVRRVRPSGAPRPRVPRVLEPATPAVEEESRPPVVSLREGEQVVRASGSGVVIRRARTA